MAVDGGTFRVLVTGGPMGGKSTALRRVAEQLGPRLVMEMATRLFEAGITQPRDVRDAEWFQRGLLPLQLREQRLAVEEARRMGKRLVVFDRGHLDSAGYMTNGLERSLEILGLSLEEAYAEMDMVIHLQSVGCLDNGAELFGTSGNQFRFETDIEEVRLIDRRLQEAYAGHPNWHFVPADLGIDGVVAEVVAKISAVLLSEDERRWLMPDGVRTLSLEHISDQEITQFYVPPSRQELQSRYRQIVTVGLASEHLQAIKIGTGQVRYEREVPVAEMELSSFIDYRVGELVRKTRRNYADGLGGVLSLDLFDDGDVTLEREFLIPGAADKYALPSLVEDLVVREVTGDSFYSNFARAMRG